MSTEAEENTRQLFEMCSSSKDPYLGRNMANFKRLLKATPSSLKVKDENNMTLLDIAIQTRSRIPYVIALVAAGAIYERDDILKKDHLRDLVRDLDIFSKTPVPPEDHAVPPDAHAKPPTSEGPDKKRAKKEAAAPPAPPAVPEEPPKRVTARKFLDDLRKNTDGHMSEWLVRSEDNVCLEWEKDILIKKMKLVEIEDYEYNKKGPGSGAKRPDFVFKPRSAIMEAKYGIAKDNKNDYFKSSEEKRRAFDQVDTWMKKDTIFAYDTWIFIKSVRGARTTFKRLPEVEEEFFDKFPDWSEERIQKDKAVPRFWLVTFSPIL